MKRLFILLTGTLLLAGLTLLSDVAPAYAASTLSTAAQKTCMKYDGKTAGSKWASNKCAKRNGGNCTKGSGGKISCTAPSADSSTDGSTSGGGAGSSTTITDPAISSGDCTKSSCDLINTYINPLITLLNILVGLAVALGIIWGGIQVSSSAGDPSKNAAGKAHIRNALVALVAYVVLFVFLQWIIPGGVA